MNQVIGVGARLLEASGELHSGGGTDTAEKPVGNRARLPMDSRWSCACRCAPLGEVSGPEGTAVSDRNLDVVSTGDTGGTNATACSSSDKICRDCANACGALYCRMESHCPSRGSLSGPELAAITDISHLRRRNAQSPVGHDRAEQRLRSSSGASTSPITRLSRSRNSQGGDQRNAGRPSSYSSPHTQARNCPALSASFGTSAITAAMSDSSRPSSVRTSSGE